MSKKKIPELTDRERILTVLVRELETTSILAPDASPWHEESYRRTSNGSMRVHFARYRKPVPGDLVMGQTGRVDGWKIAWYVHAIPGGALLREIGSNRTCNYTNEEFTPIVGLHPEDLLEGDKRAMVGKVEAAFRRGGEHMYRDGGCEFEGDEVVMWVRERYGGLSRESKPFAVRMKWNKRTTIKAILAALRAGGYGTREFEATK